MASAPKRKLTEYRRKRDFTRTPEPSGSGNNGKSPRAALRFVIQKHAASHLHFDFRLELGGVMKSWAVPKGPSLDPAVKRLAMEVEDHPIAYNTFEGTIPKGQYGGGTVMLWDRGTYAADEPTGDDEATFKREYAEGKMSFTLHGERLEGSFALIRTRGTSDKPQWLLMKHRDEHARPGSDIVAEVVTSVDTGRTMEEIASGRSRVWQSNRGGGTRIRVAQPPVGKRGAAARTASAGTEGRKRSPSKRTVSSAALEPMYASIGTAIPTEGDWTYEPKYDGIRVLAFVTPRSVKLVTRNGNDKTKQFPEVVDALQTFGTAAGRPVVLDGEIVALVDDRPARFQELQSRMHVKEAATVGRHAIDTPAAFVAFDLLLDGDDVLLHEPWSDRRRRLERVWRRQKRKTLILAESVEGDGPAMVERARRDGWEGVIAKRIGASYEPGVRSRAWLKLKIEHRQEFVIGGYTEPRNTREYIGALLLGYFDNGRFIYVGHTGGGFTRAGLREMYDRLEPLTRRTSPFEDTPKTNQRAHWVTPKVVVEVKFNEWTADGKLRQPIYLGTRDDKAASEVSREPESIASGSRASRKAAVRSVRKKGAARRVASASVRSRGDSDAPTGSRATAKTRSGATRKGSVSKRSAKSGSRPGGTALDAIVDQLDEIESAGGAGTVMLERGKSLEVSSLGKVFFPQDGYTKGDLMRYYARVSPYILPAIADRPLVLKRFPNGIAGPSFYQQNAPDEAPEVVRVETIRNEKNVEQRRIVAGDLATLLYTIQLGAISVDPWHARAGALEYADYTILDLDPGPRAAFTRIVEVARWVQDELEDLGLSGTAKTSGSSGLHVYVPLPPRTSEETALLVAQLIATKVADAHPHEATIERSVKSRPPAAVYVDYLQNIRAKTVAGVYSVRAKPGATVSTPLQWNEVVPSLDPRAFTIETVPERVRRVGDLWASAMRTKSSLRGILDTTAKGRVARKVPGARKRSER
jgi:bifunctional non-homologous end joining protein LigD